MSEQEDELLKRIDLVARLDLVEVAALELCDFLARLSFTGIPYSYMRELVERTERLRSLVEAKK